MGKRGPMPEPNALRLAKGTYRKDKHGDIDKELKPDIVPLIKPPSSLGVKGRSVWNRVGETLVKLNLLSVNDYETFQLYCETYDFEHDMQIQIAKDGHFVKTKTGALLVHPGVRLLRECLRDRARLARLFGMNPSDRTAAIVSAKDNPINTSKIATRQRG